MMAGSDPTPDPLGRRTFLKSLAAGGAGLTLAFCVPRDRRHPDPPPSDAAFAPNAFLRIDPTGATTIVVGQSELGQGVHTALAMILAEELDADWNRVAVLDAPAHPAYANPLMKTQRTAWSASVRGSWTELREAGARARAMLVEAAAEEWGVAVAECTTRAGVVAHAGTGRSLGYGELAVAAGRRRPPRRAPLKRASDFRLIGTSPLRLDLPPKVDGSAEYGIDVTLPGMLTAAVEHAPSLGGKPVAWREGDALAVAGVRRVIPLSDAVAVLAEGWWPAEQGRRALAVEWTDPDPAADGATIRRLLRESLATDGTVQRSRGHVGRALERAPRRVLAEYQAPFLAHAALEPMNCVADVSAERCVIWAPTQNQAGALETAARLTGLPPDRIEIHTTMVGGGFGRRLEQDFLAEAVILSQTAGVAVKVIWRREDDFVHDVFRPLTVHRIEGALDPDGRPAAWRHRIAGGFGGDGAGDMPYDIPNILVDHRRVDHPVREGLWRSVDFSHNCFVVESFIDELADLAGSDPYPFRRALLADGSRAAAVLDLVAEAASWGSPPPGRHQGMALTASHGTVVAQVVEVSVTDDRPKIHRVVAAIDCGTVVHPDTVRAQVEGAVAMGLSAALAEEMVLERGRPGARNYDHYPVLRMGDMPEVSVHLVTSHEAPGGVGEPGLPPVAPALGNAIYRATGRRIRRLPFLVKGRLRPDG